MLDPRPNLKHLKIDFELQVVITFKMPSKTNSLRDKLEENQLDLSLMQLTEVPVKEIVSTLPLNLLWKIKWIICHMSFSLTLLLISPNLE